MIDNKLLLIGGLPIPIPRTPLVLQQPSAKLVAMIGEAEFYECMKFCRLTKDLYLDRVKESSPERYDEAEAMDELSVFLGLIKNSDGLLQRTEMAMELLFPGSKVVLNDMIFTINGHLLTAEDFVYIQKSTSASIGLNKQAVREEFNPGNDAAKEIEAKLKMGRARIAKEKAAQKNTGDQESQGIAGYISALAIGLHLPLDTVMNYTLFQLYDQIKRFSRKQSADSALKAMIAGAKDVKICDWFSSDDDK